MKNPLDAAFARARLSLTRNEDAATRRRYSRFVGVAKRLLPATALALLLLVAVWPRIQGSIDSIKLAGLPKVDVSQARQARMIEPRYTGLDRENRPYVVTADSAQQTPKADDAISLDSPKADLTTMNGNWNELTAYVGLYQPTTQQLDLFGNVELYQDRGSALRSDSVSINMAQGTAIGHDPVEGDGAFGHVTGQGLRVLDRGETIIFTGHATLDLNPRQGPDTK